jgi:O-antigen/teichoic acid export membrane protein
LAPITVLAGLMPALFNPLLQVGAIYAAREQEAELMGLLARSTRLATVAMASIALPIIVFEQEILTVWLGREYAVKVAPILWLVVLGHGFRQLAFPYTTLLLATKKHDKLLLSPLVEGISNVIVAAVAGSVFGVRGVASAVVVGAIVGQLMNYYYNLPRTHGYAFDRAALVRRSVLRPALCFSPLVVLALTNRFNFPEYLSVDIRVALFLACFALLWKFAIDSEEQEAVLKLLSRIGPSRHRTAK